MIRAHAARIEQAKRAAAAERSNPRPQLVVVNG